MWLWVVRERHTHRRNSLLEWNQSFESNNILVNFHCVFSPGLECGYISFTCLGIGTLLPNWVVTCNKVLEEKYAIHPVLPSVVLSAALINSYLLQFIFLNGLFVCPGIWSILRTVVVPLTGFFFFLPAACFPEAPIMMMQLNGRSTWFLRKSRL